MKLHTPEGHELMDISRVEYQQGHLVVRGVVMGNMPARAIIAPQDLRAAFSLLSFRLGWAVLMALLRGR